MRRDKLSEYMMLISAIILLVGSLAGGLLVISEARIHQCETLPMWKGIFAVIGSQIGCHVWVIESRRLYKR
jgi:hypothetical protein